MSLAILEYRLGDSFQKVFKYRKAQKPLDLSGAAVVFQLAESFNPSEYLLEQECEVDIDEGNAFVNIDATTMKEFDRAQYYCRLQTRYPGGNFRSTSWMILRAKRAGK
jgi:hypothetical protein